MISDAFDVLCGHHRFTEALFATWHGTARYSTASPAADADKLLLGEGHVLGLGLGTLRIDLDQINSSKMHGHEFCLFQFIQSHPRFLLLGNSLS